MHKNELYIYCIKENDINDIHNDHDIISLIDLIPSSNEINNIKAKINVREKKLWGIN